MEAGTRPGNSEGPVLNGQGMFIGILAQDNHETAAFAAPARNVKSLLDTLQSRYAFKIRNDTGVTVLYQTKWTHDHSWKPYSLETAGSRTHRWNGENLPQGYPRVQFDHIAGDEQVTPRVYTLNPTRQFSENTHDAPTYFFTFNRQGNRLDLLLEVGAAPTLSRAVPKENALLPNYPNPFNPETWIPYQLAKPADVTLTIYAVNGQVVRRLALGHQPAGLYQNRSRAAYWDGRNAVGEPVASGLYFYTLSAGDFTATRKMLIRK